jgi:hypothetical protein
MANAPAGSAPHLRSTDLVEAERVTAGGIDRVKFRLQFGGERVPVDPGRQRSEQLEGVELSRPSEEPSSWATCGKLRSATRSIPAGRSEKPRR